MLPFPADSHASEDYEMRSNANALPSKDERASRGATLLSRLSRCFGGLSAITGSPGDAYSVEQERVSCQRVSFGIPAPGRLSLRLRWRPFQPGRAPQPLPRDHLSATRLAGTPPFLSLSSYGADMWLGRLCRPPSRPEGLRDLCPPLTAGRFYHTPNTPCNRSRTGARQRRVRGRGEGNR